MKLDFHNLVANNSKLKFKHYQMQYHQKCEILREKFNIICARPVNEKLKYYCAKVKKI